MGDKLFRRRDKEGNPKGPYYAWVYDIDGKRDQRSTGCTDKRAAHDKQVQWERDAANPARTAQRNATVGKAFEDLIAEYTSRSKAKSDVRAASTETTDFYEAKCGVWLAYFETLGHRDGSFPLAKVDAKTVGAFIRARRGHVKEYTINKELCAMRVALKLAKLAGDFGGDLDAIFPKFGTGYKARERALSTMDEWEALRDALITPPVLPVTEKGEAWEATKLPRRFGKAAVVAFIIATSAEWAGVERASRFDVPKDIETAKTIHIHGTKRETRDRDVPLNLFAGQRELLAFAIEHADGKDGKLFASWGSVRRDLQEAAARAELDDLSPNDLRRTFGQWAVRAGNPLDAIAIGMGHADTRMLERVYGRVKGDALFDRLEALKGPAPKPAKTKKTASR